MSLFSVTGIPVVRLTAPALEIVISPGPVPLPAAVFAGVVRVSEIVRSSARAAAVFRANMTIPIREGVRAGLSSLGSLKLMRTVTLSFVYAVPV